MKEEIIVPYAPILVESTRSIGYSFEAAIADIVDNSVSALASEIPICRTYSKLAKTAYIV